MQRLDLEDCFSDSPLVRLQINKAEQYIAELELKAKALAKASRASIDATNELILKNNQFSEALIEYGEFERKMMSEEPEASVADDEEEFASGNIIKKFGDHLRLIEAERQIYLEQLETVFAQPFEAFCKAELSTIKDMKKKYERTGNEFFHENSKYMAKKCKDEELFESAVSVAETRKAYHSATLDLTARLNEMMSQKDVALMEALVGMVQIQDDLHRRQHAIFETLKGLVQQVDTWTGAKRSGLERMMKEAAERKQKILAKHADMYNPLIIDRTLIEGREGEKSGYLYKKSSHTMVRPVWARRFFSLHGHILEYYTQDDEKADGATVTIDLRLCMIRPVESGERRFTFEIISPLKTYILQAENELDLSGWVEALQRAAQKALQEDPPEGASAHARRDLGIADFAEKEEILAGLLSENSLEFAALNEETRAELRAVKGNDVCADCRAPNPEWSSVTYGILICIECSGIHRSLGVQKSKVKSLLLDYWEPDQLNIMRQIGNEKAWEIFEENLTEEGPVAYERPTPDSEHAIKEQWIVAKYDLMKFIPREPLESNAFIKAVKDKDLQAVLSWIIQNIAEIDAPLANIEHCPTPLEYAIKESDWEAACLLLIWSSDAVAKDQRRWAPLHYLASNPSFSFPILLTLIRKYNADLDGLITKDGKDVYAVANEFGNAKFVEVLKLLQSEQDTKGHPSSAVSPDSSDNNSPLQTTVHIDDTSKAGSPSAGTGSGVRHSLSKMFSGYPHIHRHIRNLVQQQYNYYHDKATRSRKPSAGGHGGIDFEEISREEAAQSQPSDNNTQSTPPSPRPKQPEDSLD